MRYCILFILLCAFQTTQAQMLSLSGVVTDETTAELLAGALVSVEGTSLAAVCNDKGVFVLNLKPGNYVLNITYLGYSKMQIPVKLNENKFLRLKAKAEEKALKEVVVKADKNKSLTSTSAADAGTVKLSQKEIKQLPSLAGEQDVLKVMQLMPGVKRGGDGSSTMYVRGGGNDQNLILLDEAVVYNPAHALGLFSVFNSDILEEVQMTKGPFQPKNNGRLSSVMEIKTRSGNFTQHQAEATLGSLSAKISTGGPVIKNRLSYSLGYRRSYLDQTLKLAGRDLPYYFQDINLKVSSRINNTQTLSFTAYKGNDVLQATDEELPNNSDLLNAGTNFSNNAFALNWKYANKSFTAQQTVHYTRYKYAVDGSFAGNNLHLGSGITDLGYKVRAEYTKDKNTFGSGFYLTKHHFMAYRAKSLTENGRVTDTTSQGTNAFEFAAHVSYNRQFNQRWLMQSGVVFSGSSSAHKTYTNVEPRVMLAYQPKENTVIKAGYSRMVQYMHLISSSSFSMPTDVWFSANEHLSPAIADHFTLGCYFTSPKEKNITYSIETYYKKMSGVSEFIEGKGSSITMPAVEDVAQGEGKAYGAEFMVQKSSGKFTGWVAYTLSWATRNFDSVNLAQNFYARYDRRHDISVNGNYQITKNLSVNAVWVFATGSRFTPRTGHYYVPAPGSGELIEIPVYGKTNSAKFASTHRLDLGISWHKQGKKIKYSEWQLGCYNIYNRAQPYRVLTSKNNNGSYTYAQLGLLGFVPYISYQIKF